MDRCSGPFLNQVKGAFNLADRMLGRPKILEDDLSIKPAEPIRATTSQAPTAVEEVGEGIRYVGSKARRKLIDATKRAGMQTGYTDIFEHAPPPDAEGPVMKASLVMADVGNRSRDQDDWTNVFSDTECDLTYEPTKYRPSRPQGPIMQTLNTTRNRAASARATLRSTDLHPSGIGSAIYSGLSRPLLRSRSNTWSDEQLAEEHAWMSTKLPPESPHKKLDLEPLYAEHLSLNDGNTPGPSAEVEVVEVVDARTKGWARALSPKVTEASLRGKRKEGTRTDVRHPRDAPEGSNLDGLAIVAERVEELPRKGYFVECSETPREVKLAGSGKAVQMGRRQTVEAMKQNESGRPQTEPIGMVDRSVRPSGGPKCRSDGGSVPTGEYLGNVSGSKEFIKSSARSSYLQKPGVCEEPMPADSMSDRKRGKKPATPDEFDQQLGLGQRQQFFDIDLNDGEKDINEEEEYAEGWLCDEIEKVLEEKGYPSIRKGIHDSH
ncbi:hypothetical protein EV356DRAFT_569378 [Viridothelium virens]|uniref:Uncharacterized protein n=1 Tax=Viridothelium virens TaxID=1048519 RepID=A0A6A6H0N2_VIRVR|nr:hypothetical protein EV356DRAFT_569378 [Viridothelium virens]